MKNQNENYILNLKKNTEMNKKELLELESYLVSIEELDDKIDLI